MTSGFTPLAFRYVGDYIHSLLSGQDSEYGYYQRLTRAIFDLGADDINGGRRICIQLIEEQPHLAAACYILALVSADGTEKKRLLTAARNNDSAYDFDITCEVIGLLHRKKSLNPEILNKLATTLENLDLEGSQREQAEIALAQVFAASGNIRYALSLLAKQAGDYANHEDVLLSICARQLRDPGKRRQNRNMLEIVSKGVKNATTAQLYLGDLAYADKDFQTALDHYLLAQTAAPAWILPLQRMLSSYQQLDISDKARDMEEIIKQRNRLLEEVIE